MGTKPPTPISHFLESKGRNHRHHRHPRAENPEKQGIQGVTMGVTMAEDRHPAAESGSGTTPRISPGATETRGRSQTL
jgi:hypothetical protein